MRGPPARAQKHSFWHMVAPEFQRLAKDSDIQSTSKQMSSDRKAIRTGSHHYHIMLDIGSNRLHNFFISEQTHEYFLLTQNNLFS